MNNIPKNKYFIHYAILRFSQQYFPLDSQMAGGCRKFPKMLNTA
jgi:hypothetical protein